MEPLIAESDLYHTGMVVDDIDAAELELSELMGVTWGYSGERSMPVWLTDGIATVTFRFSYSSEGPHRLELVRSVPGTLWEASAPGQVHHLGYWCDDVPAVTAELVSRGLPLVAKIGVTDPDEPASIVIFRPPSGIYLELVDRRNSGSFFDASREG